MSRKLDIVRDKNKIMVKMTINVFRVCLSLCYFEYLEEIHELQLLVWLGEKVFAPDVRLTDIAAVLVPAECSHRFFKGIDTIPAHRGHDDDVVAPDGEVIFGGSFAVVHKGFDSLRSVIATTVENERIQGVGLGEMVDSEFCVAEIAEIHAGEKLWNQAYIHLRRAHMA